jgi:hypothetical protein
LNKSRSLAKQAVLYLLPVYEMARMRAASSPRKNSKGFYADPQGGPESKTRWINAFSHSRRLLDASDRRVVTPNNDTLYTNAWLDLSRNPLLINTPDTGRRYYVLGLLDFFTNPFGHLGTRTTGNCANRFFLHGPGWRGEVPAGCKLVSCPTNHVWVLGRILAAESEDMAMVHELQDRFTITQEDGQDAQTVIECSLSPMDLPGDAATFLRVVNHELSLNRPPKDDEALFEQFAQIGIGPGLSVPEDLTLLQEVLESTLHELDTSALPDLRSGWMLPVNVKENFHCDWWTRARVARSYIGILGAEEVLYLMAFRGSDSEILDGRRCYRLRFPPEGLPQVKAFWSLTLYKKSDYLFYDHPERRYAIGDRTEGLRFDEDGGLTLYIGHKMPFVHENWLPAPPEPFYLALRLYLPEALHQTNDYVYPPIEPVDTF